MVTVENELPVYNHRFQELASGCPHTAAEHLPLVIWIDNIHGWFERFINRHLDFLSLYIVRQGRGTHIIDGEPYGVARGDVYVMGPGMAHYFSGCENLQLDTLHFLPEIFDSATLGTLMATPGFRELFIEGPLLRAESGGFRGRWLHLTPDTYAPIAEAVAELRAEWQSGTPSGTLLTRGLFLRLLVHLARRYAANQAQTISASEPACALHPANIAAAVRYMDEHFTEPLRIEQVAASVCLSPDRFTEVFSKVMGRTPRDYLRYLRLERAKTLLRATDATVTEVAQQSGFGEAAYFIRVFRTTLGLTPGAYRKGKPGCP
ncbi:MAG TPA: AraC family transcriptional regulator [Chthonomonadaceae bacterium]|nr:AraC family transcriptional regulator [Chthonomonadaceae bacterium]